MKELKRAVILLGAGVPTEWKASLTSVITDKIICSKKFTTLSGIPLGEYIQNNLAKFHTVEKEDINFEYILNAVESLNTYYYQKASKGAPPNFVGSMPVWYDVNQIVLEMLNFEFREGGFTGGDGFLFNKANNDKYNKVSFNYKEGFYFSEVIKSFLEIIRKEIILYSNWCIDDDFKIINHDCYNFYKGLKERGYIVRFYTTNYDNLFPTIFNKLFNEDVLYNGFDKKSRNYNPESFFPNSKKILNNFEIDTYYNLHGSIFWKYQSDIERCSHSFTFSENWNDLSRDNYRNSQYTNPTEFTPVYNIVTGFSKLQKVSIEPNRSFFSALAADCSKADLILTIGYSFFDTHINKLIGKGIHENNSSYYHITKHENNYLGSTEYIRMRADVLNRMNPIQEEANSKWIKSKDEKQGVFLNGFSDFLKTKENKVVFKY